MLNPDESLVKRAYHEAGRAWALYKLCSGLKQGDNPKAPLDDIDALMLYCKKFAGLSIDEELTNWRDVAEAWRATHSIFLGGYAAERIKWDITETPSMSEPEFEKSYYAMQWFWVDLDRDPDLEDIPGETLAALDQTIHSERIYWDVINELAQTLLEKRALPARETFEWLNRRVNPISLGVQDKNKSTEIHTENIRVMSQLASHAPVVDSIADLIQAADLDVFLFSCCLQSELYPFKCPACGHIMVYCRECDTLFPNLRDTSLAWLYFGFDKLLACPNCNYAFEQDFCSIF